jgi:uncharacterized membrane protein YciS (DUF1049 family)
MLALGGCRSMSRSDALYQFVLSLAIAVLICLLLWLAMQVQGMERQLEQIDSHYRAVEPTPMEQAS